MNTKLISCGSRWGCMLLFFCLAGLPLQAAAQSTDNHHFGSLQQRLIKDGFDAQAIKDLYSHPQVAFESDGLTIFFTYSEAKLDYDQFANAWSIRKAKDYMQAYENDLRRTEERFGVDSHVITAILLVESGLGTTVGSRSALNSLSTMALLREPEIRSMFWETIPADKRIPRAQYEKRAKRKSRWAYRELKAFLQYTAREGLDPLQISGSFAGAVGYAQFMPTSILAYGRDGNDDGTIDLFTHADSMASIANYLKSHGWRPGISRQKAKKIIHHYNHSDYYVDIILTIVDKLKV